MLNSSFLRAKFKGERRLIGINEPDPAPQEGRPAWQIVVFGTLLIGVILIGSCRPVHAYTDEEAIKAVIGEAENQGYEGMLAVACAIRNRDTLKGVYGLQAKRVLNHSYSQKTLELARSAYNQSLKHDITNGATHWENIKAFGCPSWVKNCVETYRWKDHVFYKEIT